MILIPPSPLTAVCMPRTFGAASPTPPCWGPRGSSRKRKLTPSAGVWRRFKADIDSGELPFDPEAEDIHMFVEAELTRRLGETGKRLHTARSRNDQVALDLRMYLLDHRRGAGSASAKSSSASSATWPRSIRRRLCPATPICSGPSPSPSATT